MDYDTLIAEFQQRLKGTDLSALQAGPSQNLAVGATTALFHVAMQLAQFNKNFEAFMAQNAKASPAPAPAEPTEPAAKS